MCDKAEKLVLLETLRAAVLAENAQLAIELELANALWFQEKEMRLASESKLREMQQAYDVVNFVTLD